MHEFSASKIPLVYDIQELFRWIIDLSVIQILEERKLRKSDFIVTENYHIRLKENTTKIFIEKIQINFNRFTPYKGKNYSYHNILLDNIQRIAGFVSEKHKELRFDIPLIKIERNDKLELREKIMSMSTTERKALGINKSTLWYQQKHLKQGKTVKIYQKIIDKLV